MNFKKFMDVKSEIEQFPNVSVFSFFEDTVIIQKKDNRAKYQIPYKEEEDGSITLLLSQGKRLSRGVPTLEEQYETNKRRLQKSIKTIFTNYEEGVESVKKHFKHMKEIDPSSFSVQRKTNAFAEEIEKLKSSPYSVIRNINKVFAKKIIDYKESEKEYKESYNIFEENGLLKKDDVNFQSLKNQYTEAYTDYTTFSNYLSKISNFHKKIEVIVMNEDVANVIVEQLTSNSNYKVSIPKAIVSAKNLYSESTDINSVEIVKQVSKLYEETFMADGSSFTSGGLPSSEIDLTRPKFLKMSYGKYTREDLITLEHELEQSFYVLPDINDEDLRTIADWRNQVMYMNRTGIISDKKVDEIISNFNSQYGFGSRDKEFNDGEQSLGFKGTDEMSMDNASGYAYDGKTVKDDAIVGNLNVDEEV